MTTSEFFSAAEKYDGLMGPIFFAPTARSVAERIATMVEDSSPRILEVAAGTGQLTKELRNSFPSAPIIATDLNPPMLQYAEATRDLSNVQWRLGDAHDLPFGPAEFDLVVSQFGVMFFSDRRRALAEARRVLAPDGYLVQTSWDVLRFGDVDEAACRAFKQVSPEASRILSDVIHGYHQPETIAADLKSAGFHNVAVETLDVPVATTAADVGSALATGSALHAVLTSAGVELKQAAEAAGAEIARSLGLDQREVFTTHLRVQMACGRQSGAQ